MREHKKTQQGPIWPAWFYGPREGQAAIFYEEAEVPEGWKRKQAIKEPSIPDNSIWIDHEAVKTALEEKGVVIDPRHSGAKLKEILDGLS